MNDLSGTYRGKRVLITGGLGLIGSSTALALVRMGARVEIFDALLPLYGGNEFNIQPIKSSVRLLREDIRDVAAVRAAVKDKDYIFNYAAQVSYGDSQKDPLLDLDINLVGHLNILLACKDLNKDAKIIFSGSRMQYGKTQYNPVDENHPREPISMYGIHKNTAEQYYKLFYLTEGIRSTCFRITNPYGPRAQMKHYKYSIVNWFIRQAMENKNITIYGDGTQQRDYIYIDDIVQGIISAAAMDDSNGESYNIGSGTQTSFKDMVCLIVDTVGKGTIEHVPWPKDYWNVETGDFVANTDKLTSLTNWRPTVGINEGIRRTIEYYTRYHNHYWKDESSRI